MNYTFWSNYGGKYANTGQKKYSKKNPDCSKKVFTVFFTVLGDESLQQFL